MAKDPAVLFYYQDFLIGTEFMDDTDVGKYIRLLCHQFDKGKLTKKQVLSICKASAIEKVEHEILSKLKKDENGFYYNQRALEEKEKRTKFIEGRRKNALGKKDEKEPKAYAKHMEDKDKDKEKIKKYGEYFHVFLTDKQYSDLKGKVDNREKWIKIMDEAIEEKGNIWHIKNFYLALIKWYKKDNPITDKKKIYHWVCPEGCKDDKGLKTDMNDCYTLCSICKATRVRK